MPTYCYEAIDLERACTMCKGFETVQKMKDEALTKCPQCGAPIQRVIKSVGLSTSPSTKTILSDKNLKKQGFQKLVRTKDGYKNIL